jgi:hypothetical protein
MDIAVADTYIAQVFVAASSYPHLLPVPLADVVFSYQGLFGGPVFVYAAEIQPNRTRATASALGRTLLSLGNVALALSIPRWIQVSKISVFVTLGGLNCKLIC